MKDKNGIVIKEGDFIMWNPDDDNWLDIIVSHHGELVSAYELLKSNNTDAERLQLEDALFGSENPVLVVGNIHWNRIEFHEF